MSHSCPCDQIRFGFFIVRSGFWTKPVQPHDARRLIPIDPSRIDRAERPNTREHLESEIHPDARTNQPAKFLMGIVDADVGADLDEHARRNRQLERIRQAADDDLGHQAGRRLRGTPQLGVENPCIGLDQHRPRAAGPIGPKHASSGIDLHQLDKGSSASADHTLSLRRHGRVLESSSP